MKYLSARAATLLVVASLCFAGCGGSDGGGNNGDDGDGIDPGELEPLELSADKMGVGFHHGEAEMISQGGSAASDLREAAQENFSTAFLRVKLYDEFAHAVGEWSYRGASGGGGGCDATDPEKYCRQNDFQQNSDLGKVQNRTGHLAQEIERAFGEESFDKMGVVVDMLRARGDWYIRWDGNLSPVEMSNTNLFGEGNYGFFDDEMVSSVGTQLERVAAEHQPEYLVIGDDMGRLLAREEKPGLAPDDFANFRRFYQEVAVDIQETSPDTRVGVGFDWDHFVKYVAPLYGPEEKGEVPSDETLERAFESVLLPFAKSGSMLALKSYREPAEDVEYYEFLATLDQRFDLEDVEIVWYAVGSPVEPYTSGQAQADFFKDFVEWNAGVDPAVVGWQSLLDREGTSNQSSQELTSPCGTLVEEERFNLNPSHCVDGLAGTLFQEKPILEAIESELQ
jgi:hypothetical protein